MEIDVKDRNVLLVGNSVELMRNSFGRWIDLQDYVVRFGKGATLPDNKVQIGSKMDCWVTGSLRWRYAVTNKNDPHRGWPDFPLDKIPVLYNRCRINLSKPIEDDIKIDHTVMWSDEELLELFEEFGVKNNTRMDRRPSNGFLTILYFTRKLTNWRTLTLIGFDFFAKKYDKKSGRAFPTSWYKPINTITYSPHNTETERRYVRKIQREGVLTWQILSNLKEELIHERE